MGSMLEAAPLPRIAARRPCAQLLHAVCTQNTPQPKRPLKRSFAARTVPGLLRQSPLANQAHLACRARIETSRETNTHKLVKYFNFRWIMVRKPFVDEVFEMFRKIFVTLSILALCNCGADSSGGGTGGGSGGSGGEEILLGVAVAGGVAALTLLNQQRQNAANLDLSLIHI